MSDDATIDMEPKESELQDDDLDLEEAQRIEKRNRDWIELKQLRDANEVSREEFKKRKEIIFAYEKEMKEQNAQRYKLMKELTQKSTVNQEDLSGCTKCGCFSCSTVFSVREIKKYTPEGTAICPHCGKQTILSSRHGGDDEQLLWDLRELISPDVE